MAFLQQIFMEEVYGKGPLTWWERRGRKQNMVVVVHLLDFVDEGLYGMGNIILGIHHAPNCAVVAFLFDDETGKIVGSQRLSMDNLGLDGLSLYHGARLLDLGGDGYFCLVHFLSDYTIDSDYSFQIELVTFQVSRISKQTAAAPDGHGDYDDDHFLDCKFVSKEFVAEKCPDNIGHFYDAFCV